MCVVCGEIQETHQIQQSFPFLGTFLVIAGLGFKRSVQFIKNLFSKRKNRS